jgi:hypothetical protein
VVATINLFFGAMFILRGGLADLPFHGRGCAPSCLGAFDQQQGCKTA